jgi:DNA-binding NtrC family response regulator
MMLEREGGFLIVDDDPDMCWALEVILRKCGLRALKAQSGTEALRLMESMAFRLALVDAKLPDMDGLELARRMHRRDSALPIVMVSGYFYANDRAIKEAMAAGWIYGFISKPFEHEEIAKFL